MERFGMEWTPIMDAGCWDYGMPNLWCALVAGESTNKSKIKTLPTSSTDIPLTKKNRLPSNPPPKTSSLFCCFDIKICLSCPKQNRHEWSKLPNTSPGCSTRYSSPSFRQRSRPPQQPRCLLGWGHRRPEICTSSRGLPVGMATKWVGYNIIYIWFVSEMNEDKYVYILYVYIIWQYDYSTRSPPSRWWSMEGHGALWMAENKQATGVITGINGVIIPVIASRGPTCRRDKSRLQQKTPTFQSIQAQKCWRNVDKKKIHIIPSLKLTVLTWTWMVGNRSFPSWGPGLFLRGFPSSTFANPNLDLYGKKIPKLNFWPQKRKDGEKWFRP